METELILHQCVKINQPFKGSDTELSDLFVVRCLTEFKIRQSR